MSGNHTTFVIAVELQLTITNTLSSVVRQVKVCALNDSITTKLLVGIIGARRLVKVGGGENIKRFE